MINKLRDWGCDVEEALERFVNDQELYCTCFSMFLADDSFNALKQSVECGNCKASFEACHTLKGVAGNLGAGPLYAEICVFEPIGYFILREGPAIWMTRCIMWKIFSNTVMRH